MMPITTQMEEEKLPKMRLITTMTEEEDEEAPLRCMAAIPPLIMTPITMMMEEKDATLHGAAKNDTEGHANDYADNDADGGIGGRVATKMQNAANNATGGAAVKDTKGT